MSFTTCVFYLLGGALCLHYSCAVSVKPCPEIACRCTFGTTWVTDSDGCTSCNCLPNPDDCPQLNCLEVICPYGFATDENNCRTCKCNRGIACSDIILTPDSCPNGTSLTTDEHGCTICQNTISCPVQYCHNVCPHGFRNDSDGCSTCDCNPPICPQFGCPMPESCPGALLQYFRDAQGCMKCRCRCPISKCPHLDCLLGFETDSAGCPTCKCKPYACPDVECLLVCSQAFQKDKRGCKICQCPPDVASASGR